MTVLLHQDLPRVKARLTGEADALRRRTDDAVRPVRSSRLRIVLYSHDTMGLGHVRRNLGIARSLSTLRPRPDILLLTGAREAGSFPLPPGTDLVSLPAVHKDGRGRYRADNLGMSLADLTELRGRVLDATITGFRPDVVVVDKVALGMAGELATVLDRLARDGTTRTVLGLRDVLDDPAVVRRQWADRRTLSAIRDLYDSVWVYGDRDVYDLAEELDLPSEVTDKITFTGYLAPEVIEHEGGRLPVDTPFDLCVLGGGQDGHGLADVFLRARHPDGVTPVVLTGPYMDTSAVSQLRARASTVGGVVQDFSTHVPTWLRHARRVVAMGGYNTTMELLDLATPALVVPRVRPRSEQLIRAQRFAALGLLDVCHPDALDAQRLTRWLAAESAARDRPVHVIDRGGTQLLPQLITELAADRCDREEGSNHVC